LAPSKKLAGKACWPLAAEKKAASNSFLKTTVIAYSIKKKVTKPRKLHPYTVSTLRYKQFYGHYLDERYTGALISSLSCYKASINLQLHYLPVLSLCNGLL